MKMIAAIALGGALGAVSRHYIAAQVLKLLGPGFPAGIFFVNILGSFLMGVAITAFALKFESTPELRGLITVGFLGAFTTFSTYSMETVLLIERGDWGGVTLYTGGSVILGVLGLMAGTWIGRLVL
ncbi:putative fluoride ion transporter CrcB [Kordiimonas sediminis]|uniref:Fluoride-specific ion channel FluC n=1 Tax=Kordiimonas sediminis TaxID=1735581 RepID=A0A919ATC7_9PROT|nr:fluoride efflux transporter CrcB [Kordiimonas sediminis]GHF24602.1 putative fluoride ion transporter CrcB [Kordiimonas sediminis]